MVDSKKIRQLGFTRQKNSRNIIKLIVGDFLLDDIENFPYFDFIIANPPYVRLEQVSIHKREIYREKFETAVNRFDLFILFFERALKMLRPDGRLVFLTPERFEYSITANTLMSCWKSACCNKDMSFKAAETSIIPILQSRSICVCDQAHAQC